MNTINQKTISIGLLKFAFSLFVILFIQTIANAQTFQLGGAWEMFNDKNVKFDKAATITQSGANLSINNGYGANSTAVLNGNTLKTSDGLTGTISTDGRRINWSIGYVWVKQGANNMPNKIEGETTYEPVPLTDAGSTSNKVVRDTNSTPQTISYTQEEQNCFDMVQNKVAYDQLGTKAWNDDNIRNLCKGTTDPAATISCFTNIISSFNDWNRGIKECAGTQPIADSGTIKRTITIKNNSGMVIDAYLIDRRNYNKPGNETDMKSSWESTKPLSIGGTETFGGKDSFLLSENVELWISQNLINYKPLFKVTLPRNKDITTFCYEVTGTTYIPVVKTCDGSPTYEAPYIAFKNDSAFVADMRLTYYPLGGSTTKTAATEPTLLGYSRKLYLPLDADTNRTMTFSVNMVVGSLVKTLISKQVSLSDFDTVGSSCYKTWGAGFNPKANPCSLNPNARTIKLWNNGGYGASLLITYYDKDNAGKDVAKTVNTNDIEVTQTDTIEVPQGTSLTPVKIEFRNKWNRNAVFSTMNASANFTGELCYKVEGTSFAPTAATCDDTVGDTTGETRQIRFQNDAGFDAQMIVLYFEDQVINGTTIATPKTLTTGMINGLGGKFRLVSIPKNTSKGMPITISLQGNATVKGNDAIFSTTLDANFAASPQPCFKVWGTLFDPAGGKCNQ